MSDPLKAKITLGFVKKANDVAVDLLKYARGKGYSRAEVFYAIVIIAGGHLMSLPAEKRPGYVWMLSRMAEILQEAKEKGLVVNE